MAQMTYSVAVAVLLVLFVVDCSAYKWMKPAFCRTLDCPKYKLIYNNSDYEIREYLPSSWVSTNMMDIDYEAAQSKMFHKLFDYISGENKEKRKVEMTAPVIDRIIPGEGPACKNDFKMSFFVSIPKPPAPLEKSGVFLNKLPKMRVYVRSFPGYAFEYSKWRDESLALTKCLSRDQHKYEESFYYTAGYDSPFEITHRHNEVWFIAKEKNSVNFS